MPNIKFWIGLAAALLVCSLHCMNQAVGQSAVQGAAEDVTPFLLVAAWNTIVKLDLNGTNPTNIHSDNHGIIAVDYHYRRGVIFYLTSSVPGLYSIPLFPGDSTPQQTPVIQRVIRDPVGLAVDWINDKVYWTDKIKRTLEVVDLDTEEHRVVFEFETSIPQGLSLFPYPDYGWLFVMSKSIKDRSVGNTELYRITTDGNERNSMRTGLCSSTTAIDHKERKLYWIDECGYKIEETELDGSLPRTVVGSIHSNRRRVDFSRGLAQYRKVCYYSQRNQVYSNVFQSPANLLHTAGSQMTLQGLTVVHPSQQPPASELIAIGQCTPSCGNGQCVSPGLCACRPGWSGSTCSEDVNECELGNGGCEHSCENSLGSYQCKCRPSFFLGEDLKSCLDTPPMTTPTTTGLAPNTTGTILGAVSSIPTTSEAPTTPGTTVRATTATTEAASTVEEVADTTTVISTDAKPSPTTTLATTTSAIDGASETRAGTTTRLRDGPQATSIPEVPLDSLNRVPEKSPSSMTLIIIVVCTVVFLLIIVASAGYLFLVVYKYKQRRRGSYNVRKRLRESEYLVSSPRSSFRAFADHYPSGTASRATPNSQATITGSSSVESFERMSIGSPLVEPVRFEVTEIQPAMPQVVHVAPEDTGTNGRQSGLGTLYTSEQREIHFSL